VIAAEHRILLIKVTQDLGARPDAERLYEAVRGWWRVGAHRRDGSESSPNYAAAARDGRVAAVYRIEGWTGPDADGRWAFHGQVAHELTSAYEDMEVAAYYPPGAQNPLRYVHCPPPSVDDGPSLAEIREGDIAPAAVTLAEITHQLDSEPLYHLMLAHRELFHSNLLGWFFEHLPTAGLQVLRRLSHPGTWQGELGVWREWQHFDLVVEAPGLAPLIVENKVFAQPDEGQLVRYGELVRHHYNDSTCVLLSTNRPNWPDGRATLGGVDWTWLGYDRLADLISESLPKDSSYEVETMRRYTRVARGLAAMISAVQISSPDDPFLLPAETTGGVPDRLVASLAKARARHTSHLVEEAVAGNDEPGYTSSGFSNGSALVEWSAAPLPCGCRPGWQQQGRDFRLFIITSQHAGRGPELRRDREAHVQAEHLDWFDWTPVDAILGTKQVAARPTAGGFNAYAPDFVYRNKPAPDITVQQLIDVTEHLADLASPSS
jgi:hypothetical protein